MANVAPFTVQPRLTQIAMAVAVQGLIADAVCPRVGVGGELFQYTKLTESEGFTIPDTKIGRTGRANQVEFGASDVEASTQDHGLEDPVPVKDIKNAVNTNLDPLAIATERTQQLILLAREKRVADLYTTLANYAASLRATLAGANQWSDVTSDPVRAMMTAMDLMLVRPNTVVMGQAVWTQVSQHPKVVAATKGYGDSSGAPGVATRQAVAALLEVDAIEVGGAFYNSAVKGQTASYGRVWGKHCALLHINRSIVSAQTSMPTFGFTAEWQGLRAGSYMDPSRGVEGCEVVKVVDQVKELISYQTAGYLFRDAVA